MKLEVFLLSFVVIDGKVKGEEKTRAKPRVYYNKERDNFFRVKYYVLVIVMIL